MTYVTPYFKLGMIISIISLIICVALLVFTNQKDAENCLLKAAMSTQ